MAKLPNTAAREYLTPSEQSLLEEYGVTSAEFNRVSGREHGSEREETSFPGDDGSQMVKDDRPEPKNKPSAELTRDVDREAFEKKWAEELERAEAQTPDVEHDNEWNPDYDR